MFANCALRWAWWPIVFCLRAVRRPACSFLSSRRIVRRLAGVPSANSRLDNSRSDKFVHSTPSRLGSPAVNSCNKARRFASRAGCAPTHGGRPPLLCGCTQPPHPLSPRDRVDLDEWFWGRTPRPARCIRPRHGPAWRPQRPRTDGDPFPTTTQRSAASFLRSLLNTPPCSTPCAITYCGARILQLKHAGKLFLTISLALASWQNPYASPARHPRREVRSHSYAKCTLRCSAGGRRVCERIFLDTLT